MAASMEARKKPLVDLVDAVQASTPGPVRAKAEDALFRQAESWGLTSQYGDLPMRIITNDKDGAAGLKPRYQVYNAYNRLLGTWAALADFHQATSTLDELADQSTAWPNLRQKILFTKGMIWMNALRDDLHARDAFRQARALAPATPTGLRAAELLDRLP